MGWDRIILGGGAWRSRGSGVLVDGLQLEKTLRAFLVSHSCNRGTRRGKKATASGVKNGQGDRAGLPDPAKLQSAKPRLLLTPLGSLLLDGSPPLPGTQTPYLLSFTNQGPPRQVSTGPQTPHWTRQRKRQETRCFCSRTSTKAATSPIPRGLSPVSLRVPANGMALVHKAEIAVSPNIPSSTLFVR
jgi:hypothetical protein